MTEIEWRDVSGRRTYRKRVKASSRARSSKVHSNRNMLILLSQLLSELDTSDSLSSSCNESGREEALEGGDGWRPATGSDDDLVGAKLLTIRGANSKHVPPIVGVEQGGERGAGNNLAAERLNLIEEQLNGASSLSPAFKEEARSANIFAGL